MPLNNFEHLCGRVTVFDDAANIIHCHKDIGWKIDFKKLKKYFEEKCGLAGIYYYSAYLDESPAQKSFFEMLSRKGYILRLKNRWHIAHDLIQAADFYCDLKKFQKYWRLDEKPI